MPDVDVNDLSALGAITDVAAYQLPPEAWTTALNVRYRNKNVETLGGWTQIFGTLPQAPHFHMPMSLPGQQFWLYASTNNIYVYDGNTHTLITRSSGVYNGPETWMWNGTILGGIPIFNNGGDVPQSRPNMTTATRFQDLPNWPANLRAKVIRSLSPYLMAFNLTENGVNLPHTIQWSHPADPGSVPVSWAFADPTFDGGRKDLDDVQSGIIIEAMPLRGAMYIYKENSTWRATPIGGRFVFDFKPVFETTGILSHRCVALTGDGQRHVVVTQDNMIWHNGNRVVSILDDRQREALFTELHTTDYFTSFMFCNPLLSEVWFCYPTQNSVDGQPNKAIIWNYKEGGESGVVSYADGITFRNGAIGNIQGNSDELWNEGTDNWDEDVGPWSTFSRRRVVLAGTNAVKFYNLDFGGTRDGVVFAKTLRREKLAIVGRKRNGEWIVDFKQMKMFQQLWPKMKGGPINIRIGASEVVEGPVVWTAAKAFNPVLSRVVDIDPISGAALSIEYATNDETSWTLDGYKMELTLLGNY